MFARSLSDEMLKKCLFWSGGNKLHIEMRMNKYECTLFLTAASPLPGKTQQLNYPRDSNQRAALQVIHHPPKLVKAARHISVFGKQLLGRDKLCVQAKLMTAAEIQSSTLPEVVHQQESSSR